MIRGLLCDVHGVLYTHPHPVPGSAEAVARLEAAGFPHLFLTNSSLHPKSWILDSLRGAGFILEPDRLLGAVEAARDVLAEAGHHRIGWLCVPELQEDLPGFEAVPPEGPGPVDAVLIGDLGPGFTYATLNRAFRWLQEGAALVAIARNRYYQGPEGLTLDAGPFVTLLEQAAGVEAIVVGKPNPHFFRAGLARLGLEPPAVAMVGDDLHGDVLPAMDLGLRGIQVRTGKYRPGDDLEDRQPDRRVDTLAEAVRELLGGA